MLIAHYIQLILSLLIAIILMLCGHLLFSSHIQGRQSRLLVLLLGLLIGQLSLMLLTIWQVIEHWSIIRPLLASMIPPVIYLVFSRGLDLYRKTLLFYLAVPFTMIVLHGFKLYLWIDAFIAFVELFYGLLLVALYFRGHLTCKVTHTMQKAAVVVGSALILLGALDLVIMIQITQSKPLASSGVLAVGITVIFGFILVLASGFKGSSVWLDQLLMDSQALLHYLAAKPNIDEKRKKQLLAALIKQLDLQVYLEEQMNLNLLASRLNCSARELSVLVNAEFGKGFSALLNDYKVQHAANLLQRQDSQMNVTAIMYGSGFRTKSSFNKEFKNRMGCSPSEYKQSGSTF